MPHYAARILSYALRYGVAPLTLSQLEQADSAAQLAVCTLPRTLDADQARLDATLHTCRLEIARVRQEHGAQLAQAQRLLDQLGGSPSA